MDNKYMIIMSADELRSVIADALSGVAEDYFEKIVNPSKKTRGVSATAKALNISRTALYKMIRSHQIDKAITYVTPKVFEVDVEMAKKLIYDARVK